MAKSKWSRRKGWAAAIFTAAWALILAYFVIYTALDTGKGPFAALFVLAIGIAASVATLLATEGVPWRARHWSAWLQQRPLSSVLVAIFAGFGSMTAALALLEPRPVVETRAGAMEESLEEIRKAISLPRPSPGSERRILATLPGVWGEPGCAVTYRFRIAGQALSIDSERPPQGRQAYHFVGTIAPGGGEELHVVGEEPESARGMTAVFTHRTNGRTRRLTWDDRANSAKQDLDWCA